jgi:hypothetical protein
MDTNETSPTVVSEPSTRGMFAIYASKLPNVRAKFAAMTRKAAKLGLEAPSLVEVGAPFVERIREPSGSITVYDRQWYRVEGARPVLADWSLLAVLEHVDGETLTFVLDPTRPIPKSSRGAAPRCDHCRTSRTRSQTFVVTHDDGRLLHVGRSCLGDFCGDEQAAANAAALAAMIRDAMEACEDGEEFGGARGERRPDLDLYLAHVVCAIAEYGWTSKAKADKTRPATSFRAFASMERLPRMPHYAPTVDDFAKAAAVIAWVEATTEDSDYMENLRVVARLNCVRARHEGLAASMVAAYDRAQQVEREALERPTLAVHRGTVGVRNFFQVRLVRETKLEGVYGTTFIQNFVDREGACFVWFGSNSLDLTTEPGAPFVSIKATVKKHDTDRRSGAPVTVLSRVSLEERPAPKAKRAKRTQIAA